MSGMIGTVGANSGVLGIQSSQTQPSWASNRHGESSLTGAQIITWNPTCNHNYGGHFNTSNDTWTCRVNGVYECYMGGMGHGGQSSNDCQLELKINGSYETGGAKYVGYRSGGSPGPPGHHQFASLYRVMILDAGATIQFWNSGAGYVQASQYHIGSIKLVA